MALERAIEKLRSLTPMPADAELDEKTAVSFQEVLEEISQSRSSEIIRPLVASFGYGTGYGLYWGALHHLERFPLQQLLPVLIEALTSDNPGTRMWSALILGRSRSHSAVEGLIALLHDEAELVKIHAAIALGMIGDPQAVPHLRAIAVDDPSDQVRSAAEEAITSMEG